MAKTLKTESPNETESQDATPTTENQDPTPATENNENQNLLAEAEPHVSEGSAFNSIRSTIESPEEMEARIRAEVLEEIRKEESVKDEERIRAQLLAQLRQQKQEEEAERVENEINALSLFLENPEDDFFVGKLPMIVETKNIHDGQGRRYVGVTRLSNGMPAFPPPVHFPTESFAKVCFDSRVARPATTHDIEDRLEMVEQQNG